MRHVTHGLPEQHYSPKIENYRGKIDAPLSRLLKNSTEHYYKEFAGKYQQRRVRKT